MFSGLVEGQARVLATSEQGLSRYLVIELALSDAVLGESIAVNGVCLTLATLNDNIPFAGGFYLSPETLALTNLGELSVGDSVNVERALLASSRMGGHYVSGHIDTSVRVKTVEKMDDCLNLWVGDFESSSLPYLLPKGSICLDGVSLTINQVEKNAISLMLIPHTLAETTFGKVSRGQLLNVEFDYLTRIVAQQLIILEQLKGEVIRT